jgi:tetrahydromethanopterin S-methyltransferase subunit F
METDQWIKDNTAVASVRYVGSRIALDFTLFSGLITTGFVNIN